VLGRVFAVDDLVSIALLPIATVLTGSSQWRVGRIYPADCSMVDALTVVPLVLPAVRSVGQGDPRQVQPRKGWCQVSSLRELAAQCGPWAFAAPVEGDR
jgi:hypothetical protein